MSPKFSFSHPCRRKWTVVIAVAAGLTVTALFFVRAPFKAYERLDAFLNEAYLPEHRQEFSGQVIAAYGWARNDAAPAHIVLKGGQRVYICTPGVTLPPSSTKSLFEERCDNLARSTVRKTVQGELLETSAGDQFAVNLILDGTSAASVSPLIDYSAHLSRKAKAATRDAMVGFLATVLGVGFFLRRWILRALFG